MKRIRWIFGLSILTAVLLAGFPRIGAAQQTGSLTEDFLSTLYKDGINTTAFWDTLSGELKLFPFVMTLAGSYDTPGMARKLVVAGDYAYVGDGDNGLQVLDITDPTNPTFAGAYVTLSDARDVALAGDYAYVAFGDSLVVIDISNPTNPTFAGLYPSANLDAVAVAGDYAFVGGYWEFVALDISDPTNPTEVGIDGTVPGIPKDIVVAGDYAFVASMGIMGPAGVIVYDITDPSLISFVEVCGDYGDAQAPTGVAVAGDYVYVADTSQGLVVFDITDPTNCPLAGSYDIGGSPTDVVVGGDHAYVTEGTQGIHVIDVSDPTSPTPVQTYDTPDSAAGVFVAGEYAYVADNSSGIQVIQIAQPVLPPLLTGSYDTPTSALEVYVSGDHAFVVDETSGLQVIDISDPATPTLAGTYNTPSDAVAVHVSGDHAFVANTGSGLLVIDISDPATPTEIGAYAPPSGAPVGVYVSGDHAFVANSGSGLLVIDITDLTNPTLLGGYDTPGIAWDVCVSGDHAFVADGSSGLRVIDVSDPTNPLSVGTYNTPDNALGVHVSGDHAFVADGVSGLQVIDVSNPGAPALVGTYDTPDFAIRVHVSGDHAYVADRDFGLQVIDVSNPAAPTLAGTYDTPSRASGVYFSGDHVFVADDLSGLQVIQVFQRDLDLMNNVGQSEVIHHTDDDIVSVRLTTTQTDSIGWEVSANQGFNWESVTPNAGWHDLAYPGSDLLWRSTHVQTQTGVNPTCDTLFVEWMDLNADGDNDGVPDVADLCPAENASFFDRDGDGCIDDPIGTRHIEYRPSEPFIYYVHEDGAPGINDGSEFLAIETAVETWVTVGGSDFVASYGGPTTQADAEVLDGVNLVTFSDPDYIFAPGVISVTLNTSFTEPTVHNATLYRPGEIVETDVLFNPLQSYSTPTQGTGIDVESAMAHAAGHMAGISHSAIMSATMAFVLPEGTAGRTLEPDDELAVIKAYPTSSTLITASRLSGTIYNTDGATPLPGAAVFAIDTATGDTVSCEFTFPDGSYEFFNLPDGNYWVSVYPLNGSSPISYMTPPNVNVLVDTTAETLFLPEYWSVTETNFDDPAVKDPIGVASMSAIVGIDIIANQDLTGPRVVSITPEDGELGILVDSTIEIVFSEPIDVNTIVGNLSVLDTFNAISVTGNDTLLNDDSLLLFIPSASLSAQTVYKVTVDVGLTDKFGSPLGSPFVSHFTTEFFDIDTDGDGVPDIGDDCPGEDASYFDRDGDGCIDDWIGARHTLYWDPGELPFEYYIHEDGATGIDDLSDFAAVEAGVNEWTTLPGVDFSVSYLGTTSLRDADAMDGLNLVTFDDPDNDLIFGPQVIALGVTASPIEPMVFDGQLVRPGQIFDADMIFNRHKSFSTPSMGSGSDIQSVAVHEAGHLFGFFHSAKLTSTMFYILPPGQQGASLSTEDSTMFFKGYPDAPAVPGANVLTGTVQDSVTGEPVPGAIVFAIKDAGGGTLGDTVGCAVTLPKETLPDPGMPQVGSFTFAGLPNGDYFVAIYPLNGTSPIRFLEARDVSFLLDSTAVDNFVPEFWDLAESASDDRTARDPITLSGGTTFNADLILNVDTTPPEVVSTVPDNGEMDVRVDAAVFVNFSEPIDLSSVNVNTFSLTPALGGPAIGGLASFPRIKDDSLMVFKPFRSLDFATEYDLVLETGITDKFGNAMENQFTAWFETEPQPLVGISSLDPSRGIIGSVITISGYGFSTVAAEDTVRFSGVQAVVSHATPTQLVVTVPPGIPTGALVSVKIGNDLSNELTFTVLPTTEVARGIETGVVDLGATPRSLVVMPDGLRAFIATDGGVSEVVVEEGLSFLGHTPLTISGGVDELDVNPQGSRIYAVGRPDSLLHVIDPTTTPTVVLSSYPVGTEPIGILVDNVGDRAYVTTSASEIQIWDVSRRRLPTQAHAEQIGAIPSPDPNLRKKMALDPVRNYLLALSGLGKVLVFDLSGDSLYTEVSVGGNPRDIVVDPFATRAYVTDATGIVTAVRLDLDPPTNDGDIYTGGGPFGVAMTPAGRFVYVANQDLDLLQAIDLLPGSNAYRTVAAKIPHRSRPVDIVLSPGGAFAYSIADLQQQFVVTTIGRGPVLKSLSRIAGPEGAKVVLAGSGFGTDPVGIAVSFNGVTTTPDQLRETSLTVTVPAGAMSGPVRVERTAPTGTEVSNALSFEVLGPTPAAARLRYAKQLLPPSNHDFDPVLATSPKGDLLVVATKDNTPLVNGRVHIVDTKPGSAEFMQFINPPTGAAFDTTVTDVVISPDGRKAYVALTQRDTIPVIDVDRYSPTFGERLGVITPGVLTPLQATTLAVSPDGQLGVAASWGLDYVHVIDLVEGSPTENQVVDSVYVGSTIQDGAFDPTGMTAYLVGNPTSPAIHILDLDSASVDFGDLIATVPIPTAPVELPMSVSFSPDGTRCLILTWELPGPGNRSVVTFNTANPRDPTFVDQLISGAGAGAEYVEAIDVSPRGDRAIFHIQGVGFRHLDLTTSPYPVVETSWGSLFMENVDNVYAPDASMFYAVNGALDTLNVFNFYDAQDLAIESGNLQTGVVDQPLPLPLRVSVTDPGANPVGGVPVTFQVTAGGGVLTAANGATQVVATDANGYADVTLQLGSTPGVGTNSVLAWGAGLSGSPVTFSASAILDPNTQPLRVQFVVPDDNTQNVSVSTAVQVTFSRSVDATTATSSTFFLHKTGQPTIPVPSIIGFTDDRKKLSLSPLDPLEPGTTYYVKATAGLKDDSGGALENPLSSSFVTEPPPALTLTSVDPPAATTATPVVLAGTGFHSELGNNTVLFEDEEAEPFDGSGDYLTIVVPLEATTGLVRVAVGPDTSNALPFDVLVATTSSVDEVIDGVQTTSGTRGIAINPTGTMAYAISTNPPEVIPIDIVNQTSGTGIPVGTDPVAIDIHPNGKYAYVANYGSNSITIIDIDQTDAEPDAVETTILVGANPSDLVASPLGDRVYIANMGSRDISVLDVEDGSETFHSVIDSPKSNSGARAVAINPTGTRLYIGTDDGYIVVDPGDPQGFNSVVDQVDKKQATRSIAINPTGTRLVVLTTEGDVFIYNVTPGSPGENDVVDSVKGRNARTVSINPTGTLLYVTVEGDKVLVFALGPADNVSVIEGVNEYLELTFIKEFSLGSDIAPIVFDPTGSGLALVSSAGDKLVLVLNTSDVSVGPLEAAAEVTPRTLKLTSRGRWVTGSIELSPSPPFKVQNIDISTVLLNDAVPAELDKWTIEDANQNDIDELVVKFDRVLFQDVLPQGDSVEVWITGTAGTRSFTALDTIRTIRPKVTFPKGGEILISGSVVDVTWISPEGYTVDAVDVHWSPNDGDEWHTIAEGIPDAGSAAWLVPSDHYDACRVMVTLYSGGSDLGMGMSEETFTIESAVAVSLTDFTGTIQKGAPVVHWSTGLELNTKGFHLLRSDGEIGEYKQLTPQMVPSKGHSGGADYQFEDATARPNQTYYYRLQLVSELGEDQELGPYKVVFRASFSLEQNFPNPFNPNTTIRFTIPQDSHVKLVIYDVAGRRVRTLVNGKKQANFYRIVWDSTNDNGDPVASGVYFYHLEAGKFRKSKKMVVLK
ncbi:MAG: Ig-like domain-containing protein [Candidatus Latescibacterota bacterium]|nr:MAG: Ig-like domain-containing protein [Candidatus Latescibacterota bacterium]